MNHGFEGGPKKNEVKVEYMYLFGEHLKKARTAFGKIAQTREGVATKLGISSRTVESWEDGISLPDEKNFPISSIAKAYNCLTQEEEGELSSIFEISKRARKTGISGHLHARKNHGGRRSSGTQLDFPASRGSQKNSKTGR